MNMEDSTGMVRVSAFNSLCDYLNVIFKVLFENILVAFDTLVDKQPIVLLK